MHDLKKKITNLFCLKIFYTNSKQYNSKTVKKYDLNSFKAQIITEVFINDKHHKLAPFTSGKQHYTTNAIS